MEVINQFMTEYGASILYTVFTAVISFIGIKLKNTYEKFVKDATKKEVVEHTVKYIEQLYKDLDGAEKLKMAKENIINLLKEKGITITELELNVLVESACNSLKKVIGGVE